MPSESALRHLQFAGCSVDLLTREVRRGRGSARLSVQEEQLLRCLARASGEAVSREALLAQVWGYRPGIPSRAPDVAIRRLRTKLEDDPSSPTRLCTVLGQGWALREVQEAPRERRSDPEVVGRDALIAAVDAQLDEGLGVCLVGPPGVGASTVARRVLAGRDEPVLTVALDGVDNEAGLLTAVARALGSSLAHAADPGAHLAAALEDRAVLLHLDPVDAVAPWLERWLPRWGSRALLVGGATVEVPGVTVTRVPPLPPDEAARLFRSLAGVDLDDDDVRALVVGLDGLPLAIRLAAARARAVGIRALLGEDGVRFDRVASSGAPGGRAGGLAGALARSWAHLEEDDRAVLTALAAFEGPFELALAEAVAPVGWVGPSLERLEARSLLQVERSDRIRYRLFGSVRWWASRQGAPDTEGPAADRLADALIAHGQGASPATWRAAIRRVRAHRPERLPALVLAADDALGAALPLAQRRELLVQVDTLDARRRLAYVAWKLGEPDALAALDAVRAQAEAQGQTGVADRALLDFCAARRAARAALPDDFRALEAALARAREPALRIALLAELSEQHQDLGAWREARVALQQALAIDREGANRAALLCGLAHVAVNQGRSGEATATLEDVVRVSDPDGIVGERVYRTLGALRFVGGDPEGALAAWERALELARELGLWRQYAATVGNVGVAWADLGDFRAARPLVEEAIARSRELGQLPTELRGVLNLGRLALTEDLGEARELLADALARAEAHGWARLAAHGRLNLAIADQLEGRDASEALRAVLDEARAAADQRIAILATAHLACHDAGALGLLDELVDGDAAHAELVRAARGAAREATRGDARLLLACRRAVSPAVTPRGSRARGT